MPTDWASFQRDNPSEAVSIRMKDAELFQLLSGTASATLRADALSGALSPVTPDPQKLADEQRQATLQSLADSKPFGGRDADGNPIAPNFTKQMELAALNPKWAERLKSEAEQPLSDHRSAEIARVEAARQRAVTASKNGFSGRID